MSSPLSRPPVVHRDSGGPEKPPHRDRPMGIWNDQLQEGQHQNKGGAGHMNSVLSQILGLTEKIDQEVEKGINPHGKKYE